MTSRATLTDRFARARRQPPLMMLYPPIATGQPHQTGSGTAVIEAARLWRGTANEGTLYLHFPFCDKRCGFCPFYAGVGSSPEYAEYVGNLLEEAELYAAAVKHMHFSSVYLGGGTPSLLAPELIERLLRGVAGMLDIRGADITLEAHPCTIGRESLAGFCKAGVTRLSLGVQSFNPGVLRAAGRGDYADAPTAALDAALAAPLREVNIDLMYGLPEQHPETWMRDLEIAAERGVGSMTLYSTVYLPAFEARCVQAGYFIPSAEERLEMYDRAYDFLTQAGYPQPHFGAGAFLRGGLNPHRRNVALGLPTLGLGTWAYSSTGATGYHNLYPAAEWRAAIAEGRLPIGQTVPVAEEERARKLVIEGLLLAYLDLETFRASAGRELGEVFPNELRVLEDEGLTRLEHGELRLTRKGGRHLREIRYLFASERVVQTLESGQAQGL